MKYEIVTEGLIQDDWMFQHKTHGPDGMLYPVYGFVHNRIAGYPTLNFHKPVLNEEVEMNLNDFEVNATQWANDRNFFGEGGASSDKQFMKLAEEQGEVAECLGKDLPGLASEIGDMMVVLNNIAILNGLTLSQCGQAAYMKIKDRKGQWINGSYVKAGD